jgi:hypothetical protein
VSQNNRIAFYSIVDVVSKAFGNKAQRQCFVPKGDSVMAETYQDLGIVKLVYLQPSGLIIETPSGYFSDAYRRVEVDRLFITW